jgi:hypothetical protein
LYNPCATLSKSSCLLICRFHQMRTHG